MRLPLFRHSDPDTANGRRPHGRWLWRATMVAAAIVVAGFLLRDTIFGVRVNV
jgi:hypothetical protein